MIERFGKHFLTLLRTVADDPDMPLDRVPILDVEEVRRQLEVLNPLPTPRTRQTVVDMFRTAVQRNPRASAVSFAGATLSYQALDRQTDVLAASLRDRGVMRDVCVGICLERSIDMVAAVLATLKAGGAYVPMDPSYPAERLAAMVEDSRASFVIIASHETLNASDLPRSTSILTYEELIDAAGSIDPPKTPFMCDADALAYVIFTSGSTGRPKGVAMPHCALANLIEWQLDRKTFRPEARVLQYSSLSFDVSFQELFSTWASGGHLCLISDSDRRDPRRLLDALDSQRIERLFLRMSRCGSCRRCSSDAARTEVVARGDYGGRATSSGRYVARLLQVVGPRFARQSVRPVETHVVTAHLLEGEPTFWPDLPPIGTPIRNNQAFILDAHRAPLPEGVPGELYLAASTSPAATLVARI